MRSRAEVITAEYLPHLTGAVAEFVRSDRDGCWTWVLFWGKDNPIGIMVDPIRARHLAAGLEDEAAVRAWD